MISSQVGHECYVYSLFAGGIVLPWDCAHKYVIHVGFARTSLIPEFPLFKGGMFQKNTAE